MKNWSVHLWIGFNAFSNETTKISKIATSINTPNQDGKIVDEHPPIPHSRIDERVKMATFYHLQNEIEFHHCFAGICRGMSDWFLYLYLQTKDQFNNPRDHMAALGKQFKKGGGMDPTLLQSLSSHGNKDLLNLKVDGQHNNAFINHTFDYWKSNASIIINQLNALPPGAYGVSLPGHQTAFIKVNDGLGYLFDPNCGIIEIQGHEFAENFYKIVDCIARFLQKHALTPETPIMNRLVSSVRFEPVSLRH